ncbi:hypothetical protein [Fictibacillus halophilus]|uniref:hypothetical protein n=1 Tax=Fictibacillus halophilus TaxID=1610490 RepID=UPI001CF9A884|nr:hypothetical protein [Fictibacillus halophilus]
MNQAVLKPVKWVPFLALCLLVIGSNMILYMTPFFQPVPSLVVAGSMFDFLLVIPLLAYYFIIRKRFSWKLTILTAIASYGLATVIIPDSLLENVSMIPKALLLLEAGFVFIELYLLIMVIRKFPKVKASYRKLPNKLPFLIKIKQAFNVHFPSSRMLDAVVSEISMLYYALFSWRKPALTAGEVFTFHKKTSFVALNLMLIHALIIESVGLHYFFSKIDHTLSLILLFINAYSVLFLFGQMQAVKKTPLITTEDSIIINIGFLRGMSLPYTAIKEMKKYEGPDTIPASEKKYTFEALVSDFIPEKPSIELLLRESVKAELIYGFKKNVTRVVIKVDEPLPLMNIIEKRMTSENETD